MSNLALDEYTFMNVDDVVENLNISKPYAYKLIRDLNEELKRNTFETKEHLARTKIIPYFKNLKINSQELKE